MEDLYYAGGLPAVMKEIERYLDATCLTANGKTLIDNLKLARTLNRTVISSFEEPIKPDSGVAVLKGNLCEAGGIIKPSAADPRLMQHTGIAVVFENIEDYKLRIDDPDLPVDENSVLVLKNVGPKGYPGMPEVGNMGLPKKLLEKGVKDMVRISDGRMSGTGFGTVVLHVSPETAAGGTIALVLDGDQIQLDVPNRTLNLLVAQEELDRRRSLLAQQPNPFSRGYAKLYTDHVEQAHLGADFDFLKGHSGSAVTRDSH